MKTPVTWLEFANTDKNTFLRHAYSCCLLQQIMRLFVLDISTNFICLPGFEEQTQAEKIAAAI